MNDTKLRRLELSRRYGWIGSAVGLVAMIALFTHGAVAQFTPLMVISGTLAVVPIAVGTSTTVGITRQLEAARAQR